MAGFFDSLLGLESDPRERDYRLLNEISSPEELDAYRAGASATGIPGLDYARSVMRGIGTEISEPSMGPLGERYQQKMAEHRARMAAAERLRRQYPEAFRAGRLGTVGNLPGAESVFLAQPGIAGAAGAAGRAGARGAFNPRSAGPSILEGEFSDAGPQLGYQVPQPSEAMQLGYQAPRPPIAPSQSQRPMNRFQTNQGYMTTGIPGNELYGSSVGRVPRTSMSSFRDAPVKPTAGIHDEAYPSVGDQRTPFKPEFEPNKFDQNMYDAWVRGRMNRIRQRIDPAERFGGFDTDLQLFRPKQAAKVAQEEYQTPRSRDLTTFRPRMPRSTMIEGEFTEVPGANPRGWESVPGGAYNPHGAYYNGANYNANARTAVPDPSIFDSKVPMFAKQGLGMGAGAAAYLAGKNAYDRAQEILNRPSVVSEDSGRKVQLPPIDIGGPGSRNKAVPTPPRRPRAETIKTATRKPTAAAKRAEDNRRYWGDWRDVEPYASDPIGNFIDELTGSTRTARRPGNLNYAHGGAPRYRDDGGSIFDSIGGALSGLSNGRKPFHMGPVSQGLLTAGLGMMSSPSHSLARAIGEGGLAGIKAYNAASAEDQQDLTRQEEEQQNLNFEKESREGLKKISSAPIPVPGDDTGRRRGGSVRRGYAIGGGQSEDFDPFGDIGDAIGSGLQTIGDTIGSAIMPSAQAAEGEPRRHRGMGPISEGLLTAGLGMMASPSHSVARAIGEGGLRGVQAYQTAKQARDAEDREAAQQAADVNFSKELAGAPKSTGPVPETPKAAVPIPETAKTEEPETEKKPVADRVVATDRETPKEDPIELGMRRIEWLNSRVPKNATQERILNRMINEEKFKIQMAEKKRQEESRGVIGIIGQDEFGRPIRGYISGPKANQPLALPGTEGAKPVGKDVHGNDFLTSLPADMAATVQAIAEGRTKLPSGPRAAQVRAAVYQYDPNYKESRYDVTQSLAKPSGYNFGATIGSGNMAIKHLGEISDAVEDLKKSEWAGGKYRPLNWLKQAVQTNMPGGYPEVERFKTAADRFSEEATKFYRGSGGNQADIQRAIDRMNAARSPQELHDIIEKETRLFSGKVNGLGAIYNQSFKSPYVDLPEFNPLEDTSNEIVNIIRKRASKPYSHTVHDISEKKSGKSASKPNPVATGDYDGVHVTRYSDGSIRNTETGEVLKGPSAGE